MIARSCSKGYFMTRRHVSTNTDMNIRDNANGACCYLSVAIGLKRCACQGGVVLRSSELPHFFLPPLSPSSLRSQLITLPSMTTPLPSIKATRERPSQFLKLSHTRGC
eukprot:TRINITY_DN5360_c0_g1_i14.p2 TRINITY_DN5360_c0_g1~~TRINITY_DN5360_c0_g1_i14.p2  ORF type:complete len:108 (-),score=8.82 TRINITY_DN5360_c0_g1_i14:50-373(-)